ncbi:PucR family transcriptional regulator [Nocardia thailandica]
MMPKGHPDEAGAYLLTAVRDCLELSICILDGQARPEQIRRLEEEAARWARAGIPISTILRLVHDGVRLGIELVGNRADEDGEPQPVDMDRVLDLLATVTTTIAHGYAPHQPPTAYDPHAAARMLATALLAGRPSATLARQHGLEVADSYLVLAMSLAHSPRIAPDQAAQRVRAHLTHRLHDAVLSILAPGGGTVLLPEGLVADDELEDLIAELTAASGVQVTVTVVPSATTALPGAAELAHELLDVVHRLGMFGGVHRFADLALEYQLTRPGPGLDRLAELLDPLDDQPDLLHTLQCHVAGDLDRRRTARALHLHPNTIDYRLKRIAHLVGLDATRSTDVWYLRSALIARSYRTNPPPTRRLPESPALTVSST